MPTCFSLLNITGCSKDHVVCRSNQDEWLHAFVFSLDMYLLLKSSHSSKYFKIDFKKIERLIEWLFHLHHEFIHVQDSTASDVVIYPGSCWSCQNHLPSCYTTVLVCVLVCSYVMPNHGQQTSLSKTHIWLYTSLFSIRSFIVCMCVCVALILSAVSVTVLS